MQVLDSIYTDMGTLEGKFRGLDHNTWTGGSFNDPYAGITAAASLGMLGVGGGESVAAKEVQSAVVTAFRVEGMVNQRILINAGEVAIQGDNMLFIGFDRARAESFLDKRIEQFGSATIRSFQVQQSFLDSLRSNSVHESEAHMFPNSPLRVDLRHQDQFGLRPQHINELREAIIPGTGL